jgi:hypothetical protein
VLGIPDVTVCRLLSLLVHVTVLPTLILTRFGENALLPSVSADVVKESFDFVLLEKDLGVLAKGVQEGRRTFVNTLKYVFMATNANFGNMFSMAGVSLFLPFLPYRDFVLNS